MHVSLVRACSICRVTLLIAALCCLNACREDGESDSGTTPPASPSANRTPTISGNAPSAVRAGEPYAFQPSASDPDGDELQFSATSLPAWAQLDVATGELTGTPEPGEEGIYEQITIVVSDGEASATLRPFTITVTQTAMGTATLSWMPPTSNADGTALVDLSGYRIVYGRSSAALDQTIVIDNPSINAYMVERLSSGTWYFAISAIDSSSLESTPSNVAIKTIG